MKPYSVFFDGSAQNLITTEYNNNAIRKIDTSGTVTTFTGFTGAAGYLDGTLSVAQFSNPTGLCFGSNSTIYVMDFTNNRIRKIFSGEVTTLAGSTVGYSDGLGTNALFNRPFGCVVDSVGDIIITDEANHRIRKITSSGCNSNFCAFLSYLLTVVILMTCAIICLLSIGLVSTWAGAGGNSHVDGLPSVAKFSFPSGIAVESTGSYLVSDYAGSVIRRITSSGRICNLFPLCERNL